MTELSTSHQPGSAPDLATTPMQVRFVVETIQAGMTIFAPARGPALREQLKAATADPRDHPAAALVAAFLLAHRGSANTRDAYVSDLEQLTCWLYDHQIPLLAVTRHHIEAWLDDLAHDHGYKRSTTARKLSAVSSFYEYLIDSDVAAVEHNPAARVKVAHAKGSSSPTRPLPTTDAARLLVAARDHGHLEAAAISLMLLGGLRVHEVCDAEHQHIHTVEDDRRILEVQGKGDKTRPVPLDAPLGPDLDRHHTARPADSRWLLASDGGGQLTRGAISYRLSVIARQAGLGAEHVTPHRLRATFVTQALDAGVPLRDVQLAAGHADPNTTIGYHERTDAWRTHPLAIVAERLGHSPEEGPAR